MVLIICERVCGDRDVLGPDTQRMAPPGDLLATHRGVKPAICHIEGACVRSNHLSPPLPKSPRSHGRASTHGTQLRSIDFKNQRKMYEDLSFTMHTLQVIYEFIQFIKQYVQYSAKISKILHHYTDIRI